MRTEIAGAVHHRLDVKHTNMFNQRTNLTISKDQRHIFNNLFGIRKRRRIC